MSADTGQTVRVHYTGTLDDETQFDSSRERGEPLEFTLGLKQVVPGFEAAIVGMAPGDRKTVKIPASEAYGQHEPEMIADFPRETIGTHIELAEGMVLSAQDAEGRTVHFSVISFTDEMVKLDGNHPLAGKDLTFDIELVEIL